MHRFWEDTENVVKRALRDGGVPPKWELLKFDGRELLWSLFGIPSGVIVQNLKTL